MNEEIISNYELKKFNAECIEEFLKMNNLNSENYFFGMQLPGITSHALLGQFAAFTASAYIVSFDNNYIYVFGLSKVSNRKIVNSSKISIEDIESIESHNVLFGTKKVIIKFKEKGKLAIQCKSKAMELPRQMESLNKFILLKQV